MYERLDARTSMISEDPFVGGSVRTTNEKIETEILPQTIYFSEY